ncbi:MAG: CatB-related O-acetyltransferase [Sphaerospermopsis sp. SIO1G1]|nr:CatB-related O-acetyltransferase [Sphaerospermopsis sp. SIO1G1]
MKLYIFWNAIIHRIKSKHHSYNIFLADDVFVNLDSQVLYKKDLMFFLEKSVDYLVNIRINKGTGINSPFSVRGCGELVIGKYAAIGKDILVITSNHAMNFANMQVTLQNKLGFTSVHGIGEKVNIGNATWIGDRVTFLPGSSIGDGCIVGAGSIVTKQFPAFQVIAGNPARIIRPRFSEAIINQLLDIRWWDWPEAKMKQNRVFFETNLLEFCESSVHLKSLIL